MKKNFLFVAMSLLALVGCFGCSETAEEEKAVAEVSMAETPSAESEKVMDVAEVMPEFPGGMKALLGFLGKNIAYPKESLEKDEQGRVVCRFVIAKDGTISDVEVVRSVSAALDNEAIRVIKSMPKWKPGMNKGKPVAVQYTLPVQFKLQ